MEVKVTIRLDSETRDAVKREAEKDLRSLNQEYVVLLREAIEARRRREE